jgi:aminoglycoside 2'-N-acetyltransferase I
MPPRCEVLSPDGIRLTPDKDGILYALPTLAPVDVTGELTRDWRPGSVW